ncbi:MAG: head-tail joining protein [Sphingomicrobium sp.]
MPIDWNAVVIGPLQSVFGEPVIYTPQGGAAFQITGVFDDAYQKEVIFDDATTGVTTVAAVLGIQLSQFSVAPAQNDALQVTRTGATYVVREVRVDSRGGAKLLLSKSSNP